MWLIAGTAPGALHAQTTIPNQFNPLSSSAQGVHLNGVSIFSGYYSQGIPYASGIPVTVSPGATASYDVSVGAVAAFGWNRSNEKSGISLEYSPSYFGSVRHSEYNSFNHRFGLNWSRKLSSKLTFGASAAGMTASFEQSLFSPNTLSSVAALPTTFDDLTSAVLAGKFTNTQLASLLTGTPLVPVNQSYLYGQRTLDATAGISLSYTLSTRSTLEFSLSGMRMQQLRNTGVSAGSAPNYLIPQTTSAAANINWSYSVTPRTQIGISVASSRMFARTQEGYSTYSNFSVGRTLSRRWFVEGRAGAGKLTYTHVTFQGGATTQYLAGGSIGFKTYGHTFMAGYNRTLGDMYGLGSGSTGSGTGAWNWRRPGSTWSLFSSFIYQRLGNTVFNNPISWQASAGLAKQLSSRMFMNLQYAYVKFPYLSSSGVDFSQSGVVVTLNWSPSEYR